MAETIAAFVRDSDVVYRYGGEEFSMLLPGASPEEAAAVAERVRAAVEQTSFPGEELQPGGKLTVSVGVATLANGSAEDIRERADAALGVALHRARRARPEPQPTMQLPSAASSRERCGRQQTSSQHIEPA